MASEDDDSIVDSPSRSGDRPRILVTTADFETTEELIGSDEYATAWYEILRDRGDELLDAPPREYEIPDSAARGTIRTRRSSGSRAATTR